MRCVIEDNDASARRPAEDGDAGVGEFDGAGGVVGRFAWAAAGTFLWGGAEARGRRAHG